MNDEIYSHHVKLIIKIQHRIITHNHRMGYVTGNDYVRQMILPNDPKMSNEFIALVIDYNATSLRLIRALRV